MRDTAETYLVTRSDEKQILVLRLVPPRFTVRYVPENPLSNIDFIDIQDEFPIKAEVVAGFMREIGDEIALFLEKEAQPRKHP